MATARVSWIIENDYDSGTFPFNNTWSHVRNEIRHREGVPKLAIGNIRVRSMIESHLPVR